MNDHRKVSAVVTVGSVHMDLIATVDRIPVAGESRVGRSFIATPGGKAANQAAQAARCGVPSFIVARAGTDQFGDVIDAELSSAGIDTTYLTRDAAVPTGASTVLVGDDGEYASVIVLGSASRLSSRDFERAVPAWADADVLLLQLELPLETSLAAARAAKCHGARVILNAAPVSAIPGLKIVALLDETDIVVLNMVELGMLTDSEIGVPNSARAATMLLNRERGLIWVVVTLGKAGAIAVSREQSLVAPALEVSVVDTIGAGDAFMGAFAARLASGAGVADALLYGTAAGSLATTRAGALSGQATDAAIRHRLPEIALDS